MSEHAETPFQTDPHLVMVQRLRKLALLAAVAAAIVAVGFGQSIAPDGKPVHEVIEKIGIALIMMAILGRTWCSLYIGGRKRRTIVQEGPYSVSRNPLYLFSFLGAVGAGAQLGSVVMAVAAGVVAVGVFRLVVLQEERYLTRQFGAPYLAYVQRVPRFWPRFSLWTDVEVLEVRPRLVVRTFIDASLFLLALPIAEVFEQLHAAGIMPVWFSLP